MKMGFRKYYTLRNQILVVFLIAMMIVLLFVGMMTYKIVANLLKDNAELQLQETAIQANGRIETLYDQIDMLTKQVVTNASVQQRLLDSVTGNQVSFAQRQSMIQVVNTFQTYSSGINALEIYLTDYQRFIPLDEANLENRIDRKWIDEAFRAKGRLIWIGQDPRDPDYFLAIRRVSLMDRWFSSGGYLLIQINPSYFEILETEKTNLEHDYMILVDQNQNHIASNYTGPYEHLLNATEQIVQLHEQDYMMVQQKSEKTGWTLIILTPVSSLLKGIPVLQTATILSGVFGFLIFALFSLLLSTVITKPLRELTMAMRRGRDGDLTLNPEISSTIEINELNSTYNQLVENTNHLIQVVYEKEISRSRTELKALQAQINPHFLFNTLDALYWSLEDKGEEELAELVIAMSELFRYTISNPNQNEWVTLKQELEHVERYMQIMKVRFGNRFNWSMETPAEYGDVKIPKLIIQPLVENAIQHGIGKKLGQGHVAVVVIPNSKTNLLEIKIIDDGPGMEPEKLESLVHLIESGSISIASSKGKGMAIANVHNRLKLYYEKDAVKGIRIKSALDQGTCISLEVPIKGGMM